ncbi:MAG: DUF3408 domain-containing protein [Rikenellaceae bacterium]
MTTKRNSIEGYKRRYCKDQRIRDRKPIYVSREVHEKMSVAVKILKETHTSMTSLVDSILREHIATNRDVLNKEYDRQCNRVEHRTENSNY